jgi:hypothetical protein
MPVLIPAVCEWGEEEIRGLRDRDSEVWGPTVSIDPGE